MKKSRALWLAAVAAGFIAWWGCSLDPGTGTASSGDSAASTGTLVCNLTALAPWVVTDKGDAPSELQASSRAALRLSRIDFTLKTAGGSVVDSWSVTPPASPVPGAPPMTYTATTHLVPAGNDYVLEAKVFNTAVSSSNPVVSGTKNNIDVPAGGTSGAVTVTCKPVNPTTVNVENAWSASFSLTAGGEKWFSVSTPYTNTYFAVESLSGDMDIYIFNPDGTYTTYKCTGTTAVQWSARVPTPGNPYYVGMWAYTGGSGRIKWDNVDGDGNSGTVGPITVH